MRSQQTWAVPLVLASLLLGIVIAATATASSDPGAKAVRSADFYTRTKTAGCTGPGSCQLGHKQANCRAGDELVSANAFRVYTGTDDPTSFLPMSIIGTNPPTGAKANFSVAEGQTGVLLVVCANTG
jgi:hypothetical protein